MLDPADQYNLDLAAGRLDHDFTELSRRLSPTPPVAADAVDVYLLKSDPTIRTNLDLYRKRMARRVELDLELEAACLLVDPSTWVYRSGNAAT